ncbi:hypothetical protein QYE76_047401 [Lolium multiflorum]|uniref:Uncharacterized protein n=1 Tax=Lolium multiflorum TaxID=4521 RepID=A0AAD8X1X9_LOLMU|nr:hypothetical protein QYE76_047401 [Lolium multiflorum]
MQDDPETSIPVRSPQGPKKKKAKTGAASDQELAAESTSIPLLDDALHCAGERADDLEVKLKASEEAHERAEKDAVSVEDLRQRLQASEDALSDKEAKFIQRENDIITRLETQSRRFTSNIVFLACDSALVLKLAQQFLAKDDPALAYRQASLNIGVEGTIALVAATAQNLNWVKAAAPKGLNTEKWKAFVKGAKLYSKNIITFLDPKSSASASTTHMEVK